MSTSSHDPEQVKAQTNKKELPPKVRAILEEEGIVKPPTLPNPRMPKIDELVTAGKQQGLGFRLSVPEPDDEAEPEDQVVEAVFFLGAETWTGEDDHPAVATATALAEYFADQPKQSKLAFGQAAD